jgi:hypothetical protein
MEAAQLLLAAGTPDYFMGSIGAQDVIQCLYFIRPTRASALLHTAVQHGHVDFAKMLQQQGVWLPNKAGPSNVR